MMSKIIDISNESRPFPALQHSKKATGLLLCICMMNASFVAYKHAMKELDSLVL